MTNKKVNNYMVIDGGALEHGVPSIGLFHAIIDVNEVEGDSANKITVTSMHRGNALVDNGIMDPVFSPASIFPNPKLY